MTFPPKTDKRVYRVALLLNDKYKDTKNLGYHFLGLRSFRLFTYNLKFHICEYFFWSAATLEQ